jgi:steroid 5-alpha reductase family enzyme
MRTLWPAMVGALAVLAAASGNGAWARRSAITWMMGSWGARRAVQGFYTRGVLAARPFAHNSPDARGVGKALILVASAIVCSAPAWLAASSRAPELSWVELAACGIWFIGFAGETTADRQRLRFAAAPAHQGMRCRAGLWRYSPHVDRVFTALVWVAFSIFGFEAVWGP